MCLKKKFGLARDAEVPRDQIPTSGLLSSNSHSIIHCCNTLFEVQMSIMDGGDQVDKVTSQKGEKLKPEVALIALE